MEIPDEILNCETKSTQGMHRRSFLRKGTVAASVLVGGTLNRALSGEADNNEAPGPIVQTTAGKVRGAIQSKVNIFKGVPYGASTAGPRRFMPPVRPPAWTGVRDAIELGQMAPQHPGNLIPEATIQRPKNEPMGEDCLCLNVWTAGLGRARKRPVMVWLHGGGFAYGSGGSSYFDGTNLAGKQDVVVVTLNSRLNVFGFLYLCDVGGPKYANSGNLGMLDIVAALEWVRDNIAAFGGDPGNVTLLGQSSGGGAVSTLMAMPAAKGLFHRAVVQSGTTVLKGIPRDRATRSAETFLEKLGLNSSRVDELQNLSMEQLLDATQGARLALGPVVDGHSLPTDPFDPAAPEMSASVPLLIGSLSTEISMNLNAPLDPMDDAGLHTHVKQYVRIDDAETDKLIAVYKKSRPEAGNTDLYLEIASDSWIRMNMITEADRKAAQKAPVYMYYFTWKSPVRDGKLRTPHTLEIAFMFDNVGFGEPLTGSGPDQSALADKMSGAWAAFARTGNPNHKGIPAWPAYTAARRATMVFDNQCKVAYDPDRDERLALSAVKS
jgi:para-nitrobenzyl esterase